MDTMGCYVGANGEDTYMPNEDSCEVLEFKRLMAGANGELPAVFQVSTSEMEQVGCGGEGVVYKLVEKYAAKAFRSPERAWWEFDMAMQANGDGALKPLGLYLVGSYFVIVYPYAEGGSLVNYIGSGEDTVKALVQGMLEATDKVHQQEVIHNDEKLSNFVVYNGRIYLTDFGHSYKSSDTAVSRSFGTRFYAPPECIVEGLAKPDKFIEKRSTWAIGIGFLELLIGPIYQYAGWDSLAERAVCDSHGFEEFLCSLLDNRKDISQKARKIIITMLAIDPACRPTPAELLNHDWFKEHYTDPDEEVFGSASPAS